MTRRELREHTFKILFCIDFYPPAEVDEQIDRYLESKELELTDDEKTELRQKSQNIIEKITELDVKIDQVASGWQTKRMGKVEISIMRLALYEILYDDSIPVKVSINEAVEIAKKYGGEDSSAFVNGILAKLV